MKLSKDPFETSAEFEQFRWQTAAKILAGMLSNPVFTKSTASTLPYEDEVLAGWAVDSTDALIEQLAGKEIPEKQKEQKPAEWDEDDEYLLIETIQHLEELIRIDEKKHCGVNVQYYQRDIDWLKSLRPSWKPEGQQLDCLRHMINVSTVDKIDKQFVIDLYEQLKKL